MGNARTTQAHEKHGECRDHKDVWSLGQPAFRGLVFRMRRGECSRHFLLSTVGVVGVCFVTDPAIAWCQQSPRMDAAHRVPSRSSASPLLGL